MRNTITVGISPGQGVIWQDNPKVQAANVKITNIANRRYTKEYNDMIPDHAFIDDKYLYLDNTFENVKSKNRENRIFPCYYQVKIEYDDIAPRTLEAYAERFTIHFTNTTPIDGVDYEIGDQHFILHGDPNRYMYSYQQAEPDQERENMLNALIDIYDKTFSVNNIIVPFTRDTVKFIEKYSPDFVNNLRFGSYLYNRYYLSPEDFQKVAVFFKDVPVTVSPSI